MDWYKQEAERWGRVASALKEATRGIDGSNSQMFSHEKIERMYCTNCARYVDAEWTYDHYSAEWTWQCMNCGENI